MTIPSRTPSTPRVRRGMTLVELLVVIVVIGILMGLLLPAVMKARSAARKAACANNLKQLAAAVHQFHERQGSMPTYWGAMHGRGGDLYGGWLLHLLPDLDQQAFYDSVPRGATVPRKRQVRGAMIRDAIPASDDYYAGDWVEEDVEVEEEYISGYETVETGDVGVGTIEVPIYGTRTVIVKQGRRINARGTPPAPAEYEWYWQTISGSFDPAGIPPGFENLQSQLVLPVLQCHDDPSPVFAAPVQGGSVLWSLTNYQASAHAFMNFAPPPTAALTGPGGRLLSTSIMLSATMGGRFPRPIHTGNSRGTTVRQFRQDDVLTSGTANSLLPRTFDHILDGLTNTILFGEGMRQCNGGASYRAAFLPTGSLGNEHAFGIEPTFLTTTGSALSTTSLNGFGHTMMFQLRPGIAGCSKFRLQASHEDVLNVAMADGSTRGISATVSRREMADPDVSGRQPNPNVDYNAIFLGGRRYTGSGAAQFRDGVWDMLLMPTDGQWQALTNTGEIGKER